jgi:hypothetical protein
MQKRVRDWEEESRSVASAMLSDLWTNEMAAMLSDLWANAMPAMLSDLWANEMPGRERVSQACRR